MLLNINKVVSSNLFAFKLNHIEDFIVIQNYWKCWSIKILIRNLFRNHPHLCLFPAVVRVAPLSSPMPMDLRFIGESLRGWRVHSSQAGPAAIDPPSASLFCFCTVHLAMCILVFVPGVRSISNYSFCYFVSFLLFNCDLCLTWCWTSSHCWIAMSPPVWRGRR